MSLAKPLSKNRGSMGVPVLVQQIKDLVSSLWIQFLAQELPCVMDVSQKKKKESIDYVPVLQRKSKKSGNV